MNQDSSSRLLIALNAASSLSRDNVCRLGASFHLWSTARECSLDLAGSVGVKTSVLRQALAITKTADRVARLELEKASALGIQITTLLDASYPRSLRDLDRPPPVLYLRGHLEEAPRISIVGSRKADPYGLEATRHFATGLVQEGLTVVSGLAVGIDTEAHRSALESGGRSIAILGCGLDLCYPLQNADLQEELAVRGAIVSEFPLGTEPRPGHFPIRNRIIAALGAACLVVQAAHRSGSLITARLALDLGREIYAVPGRIFDTRCLGSNALIRDGAFPVQRVGEILDTLPLAVKEQLANRNAERAAKKWPSTPLPVPSDHRQLFETMAPGECYTVEELAAKLELPIEALLAALLELELGSWIERRPGPLFKRRVGRRD